MRIIGSALALATLTACGGAHPEPSELYGLWSKTADGTETVLEFAADDSVDPVLAGLTDVFHLYQYPSGTAAVAVQSGTFVVSKGDGWELVTTISWDTDGAYTGMSFGNPIAEFDGDVLTLDRDDGTQSVYTSVDVMP